SSGQCVCLPATTCPNGQNCGTALDGCGGVVLCGACTAPATCGGAGVPNQCGCTPAVACPAGQNCGTAPDGCGGTLDCGTCGAPQTCGGGGVPNRCGGSEGPCSPNGGGTLSCLGSRGPSCTDCAMSNGCLDPAQGGGTCEDTHGPAPSACQTPLLASAPVSE